MKKILILSFLISLIGVTDARSQTVNQTLEFDHAPNTLAVVNTYTHTLKINTGAAVNITPTCATAGANVHCTFPLTTSVKSGDLLIVTATNGAGSSPSAPFTYNPGNPPSTPTSVTITIIIKVP